MIRFIKINWTDILDICKVQNVDRPIFFCFRFLKVLIRERHIPSRFNLKSFHNAVPGNFFSTACANFFIFDTRAVFPTQLMERDIIVLGSCVE